MRNSPPDAIRVRFLSMYPPSVVFGGQELQYMQTKAALEALGLSVQSIDYCNTDDEFDVLHLFGASPNYYDLCQYAAAKYPIVLSAVSGARYAWRWRALVWATASRAVHLTRLQTNYDRLLGVCRNVSAIFCLNELEAQFLQVTYSVPRDRIHIVPNGVQDRFFHASGDLFYRSYGLRDFVLFTGNIVPRKNPLELATALRASGHPGVFIGGVLAAERAYAQAFASIVETAPNLRWIPRLAHDDPLLTSAYGAARVFCLPSSVEAQSLSALEAMAAGLPLVLGDVPYAYQAPFERSAKCNAKDPVSLRACLDQVIAAPDNYRTRLPDSYQWPAVAQQIASVYHAVMKNSALASDRTSEELLVEAGH